MVRVLGTLGRSSVLLFTKEGGSSFGTRTEEGVFIVLQILFTDFCVRARIGEAEQVESIWFILQKFSGTDQPGFESKMSESSQHT